MIKSRFTRAGKLALAVCCACSLAAGSAVNAEAVGRTDFDSSNAPWIPLTQYQSSLKFNGGEHAVTMETKAFYLAGPGSEPIAVLVLTSTDGGNRSGVRWVSETCPPARSKFFTDDFDSAQNARSRQCLVVNSAFATTSYLKPDSEIALAAASKGLTLFKSGYSIRSVYGAHGGTLLRVNLMTNRKFVGLPNVPPKAEDTHGTPESLVAWGEALQKSVEDSVLSLSGRLVLPPISF